MSRSIFVRCVLQELTMNTYSHSRREQLLSYCHVLESHPYYLLYVRLIHMYVLLSCYARERCYRCYCNFCMILDYTTAAYNKTSIINSTLPSTHAIRFYNTTINTLLYTLGSSQEERINDRPSFLLVNLDEMINFITKWKI